MCNDHGFELLLEFYDPSSSFVHGFACGIIWHKMKTEVDEFSETVLAENRTFVETMTTASGWHATFEDLGEDWVFVTFRRD